MTDANAKGFYEAQGWGPDFIVPTRSRIDVPDDWAFVSLSKLTAPIEVKGIAFGGDRGISRVELSFDDGQTWSDAEIYYSGGNLAWSLWKAQWTPAAAGDYPLARPCHGWRRRRPGMGRRSRPILRREWASQDQRARDGVSCRHLRLWDSASCRPAYGCNATRRDACQPHRQGCLCYHCLATCALC